MVVRKKKNFDALDYVKTSKAFGVNEELAEFQARQIENAVEMTTENIKEELTVRDLATKTDILLLKAEFKAEMGALRTEFYELKTELKVEMGDLRAEMGKLWGAMGQLKGEMGELRGEMGKLRADTIQFIVWTGAAVVVALGIPLWCLLAKGFHWF